MTRLTRETFEATDRRQRVNLNLRAQYQKQGNTGFVSPFVAASRGHIDRFSSFSQPIGTDPPAPYDHAVSATDWDFSLLRLLGQWRHQLGNGMRLEWRGNGSESRNGAHTLRHEFDAAGALSGTVDDAVDMRDRSLSLGLKGSQDRKSVV